MTVFFIEVDNARLNGRVISFYSTASNTIPSVISEDWLIMKHAYLQNCVYCVYCIYTEGDRGTLMKIILKNNSDFPIYEQIKQQVKRAYEDLEKDGFVTTIRGKGTFVKEQDSSILKEKQFFTIENLVKELVNEAQAIEMSLEELQDILTFIYEEESS